MKSQKEIEIESMKKREKKEKKLAEEVMRFAYTMSKGDALNWETANMHTLQYAGRTAITAGKFT